MYSCNHRPVDSGSCPPRNASGRNYFHLPKTPRHWQARKLGCRALFVKLGLMPNYTCERGCVRHGRKPCSDCRVLSELIATLGRRYHLLASQTIESNWRTERCQVLCCEAAKPVDVESELCGRTPRWMHELLVVRAPGSEYSCHPSNWPTLIKHGEGALPAAAIDGRIAFETAPPRSWGSDYLFEGTNLGPRRQALLQCAAASLEAWTATVVWCPCTCCV